MNRLRPALLQALAALWASPLAAQTPEPDAGFRILPAVNVATERNLFLSLAVLVCIVFARRGILAVVARRVTDPAVRYRWAKATATAGFVVSALFLVQIWFTAIRSLGTFLGLVSAGLAIALKDLVADLAGWVFIVWTRPFDSGDRIQIGEFKGDVVDRRIFQFTIMEVGNWIAADQSTGRLIHIPNAALFTQPLANYTSDFPYLWNELKVTVTFESNWQKAKQLLREIADDFTIDITKEAVQPRPAGETRFLIQFRKATPIVYLSVEPNGILLTLRYLCRPRERRGSAHELWERILTSFLSQPDIRFAYPTQRVAFAPLSLPEPAGDGAQSEAVASEP